MQIGWVMITRSQMCAQPWNQTNYDFHVPIIVRHKNYSPLFLHLWETLKIEAITSDYPIMDLDGQIC